MRETKRYTPTEREQAIMETKKFSRPDDRLTVFAPRGVQRKLKEENNRQGTVSGVSFFDSLSLSLVFI